MTPEQHAEFVKHRKEHYKKVSHVYIQVRMRWVGNK